MSKVVVAGTRGIPNIMGGVETHCEELFPRLAGLGYDVTVIRRDKYVNQDVDKASGVCCCPEGKRWNGVKLVDVASPNKKSLEAIVHTFRAINTAKNLGADIIHIHAIGPAMLAPYAKLRGLRVVFTHHGPDYDRDKWGGVAKMMLKFGERMGCRFADEVIVISNVIKDLIARKYGRTKNVHLIYNGVPAPEICTCLDYFGELGIEEHKYILGMCRFVPEKNLHHLVEAFSALKAAGRIPEGYKLVLAGDTDFEDDYSRHLKSMARDNGVVLTGFIKGKKLHSLLANCSGYVLPSSHEGLPIALLEAMSYGVPVVVSDIPANLEIGLPDDCYFPCGNVSALIEKLESLMSSSCTRFEYDMSSYNWDEIAKQVSEVYGA